MKYLIQQAALALPLLIAGASTQASSCGYVPGRETAEVFTLGKQTQGHNPYRDLQAKGTLILGSDVGHPNTSPDEIPTQTLAFVLRPAAMGDAFDEGRWTLDIPSQGARLRFDPVPHAQYIRSFQVQKGPRRNLSQSPPGTKEYEGLATQKDPINGQRVVVKDEKGLFKRHILPMSGHVFLTASNATICVNDFVSARVVLRTTPKPSAERQAVNVWAGGEATQIDSAISNKAQP